MQSVKQENSNFYDKLTKTIKDYGLLRKGDRIIVAVSGGVDSTVLLTALNEIKEILGIADMACASFDHNIRRHSHEDVAFVGGLCKKLSVEFFQSSKDVISYARKNRLNLEEAARILRYGFLMETAGSFKASKIAVAHHLDDLSENFIMRLMSGSGSGSLSGFKPDSGKIIRPLFNHTKTEILDFAKTNKIDYREDSTNSDTKILRNFVRLKIIPLIKERNISFAETIGTISEVLRKDDEYITQAAGSVYSNIALCENSGRKITFKAEDLKQLDNAILYRILKFSAQGASEGSEYINENFFTKKTIVYNKHFKSFINLIHLNRPNSYFYITSFLAVRKEYDKIIIEYAPMSSSFKSGRMDFELPAPFLDGTGMTMDYGYNYSINKDDFLKNAEKYEIKIREIGQSFYIARLKANPDVIRENVLNKEPYFTSKEKVYFDFGKITFPVTLRQFKEGDRFSPLGLNGRKKVKEYFIDKKVPVPARKILPLVNFGNEISWIPYFELGDNIKITKNTREIGIMSISQITNND